MQASSAQLCQDVCGAFDGLPLHGTHDPLHDPLHGTRDPLRDPMEEAPDEDGLHLDDLHELGLLPHGTSDDPFCAVNTQQPQQQNDRSCRATKTHPNSSSNFDSSCNVQQQPQQQQNNAQLCAQHACSTSSCEHQTVDRQGMKGSTAGQSQAHHGAALHVRTVTQAASHRSFIPAAVPWHPQQSELLAGPATVGLSNTSAHQVAAERESHDSSCVSQHTAQPSMHNYGGAGIACAELLKAAGEHQPLDVELRDAHLHTSAIEAPIALATCQRRPVHASKACV